MYYTFLIFKLPYKIKDISVNLKVIAMNTDNYIIIFKQNIYKNILIILK